MNKPEFISRLAQEIGKSRAQIECWVESIHHIISKRLQEGEKVVLAGFGTFLVSHRKKRKGRNPQTGETIDLKASSIPHFRAGKEFKKIINQL